MFYYFLNQEYYSNNINSETVEFDKFNYKDQFYNYKFTIINSLMNTQKTKGIFDFLKNHKVIYVCQSTFLCQQQYQYCL